MRRLHSSASGSVLPLIRAPVVTLDAEYCRDAIKTPDCKNHVIDYL